jgi:dihydropyrimidinase
VDVVLSRGEVLVDDAGYHGRPGHGQFVKRGLSQYLV